MKGVNPDNVWVIYDESNGNGYDTYLWTAPTLGMAVRKKMIHKEMNYADLSEPRRTSLPLLETLYTRGADAEGCTYWKRKEGV